MIRSLNHRRPERRGRRAFVLLALLLFIFSSVPLSAEGLNGRDENASAQQNSNAAQRRRQRKRRAKGQTTMTAKPMGKSAKASEGTWGGQGIRLVITESGAQIEYDCAHGTLDQPLTLDANGRFDVAGTHTQETPGPIRVGLPRVNRPARYTGSVEGETMTLTVTLTDTKDTLGPFTLYSKQTGVLRKCR